jgi:hypothetical protein
MTSVNRTSFSRSSDRFRSISPISAAFDVMGTLPSLLNEAETRTMKRWEV